MDIHAIMCKIPTRLVVIPLYCLSLAFASQSAFGAQTKPCSVEDVEAADAALDSLDSWTKVEQSFRKYGHCDDGSIAEGNSEAVARLLVDHWSTVPLLARLVKGDPKFRRFVLRHIDTTLDTDDLDKISIFAKSRCPRGTESLCSDLGAASARAAK
jgi:hypothetical protein